MTPTRPNRAEWFVYVLTMFLLVFGQPQDWRAFRQRPNGLSVYVPSETWPITVWLVGAAVFALASTGFDLRVIRRGIVGEPFLATLLGWTLLSCLWTSDLTVTRQLSFLIILITVIGYVMVARFSLRDTLAMAGVAMGLGTILQFVWISAMQQYAVSTIGWAGINGHRNLLGHTAVLGCLIFAFCFRLFPRYRIVNLVFLGLNVALVLGTNSKTSLVSVIMLPILLLIYWALRARRTLFGAVWITMLVSGLLLTFTAVRDIAPFARAVGRDPRLSQRLDIWNASVDLIGQAPIFGNGYGATWVGWFSPGRAVWLEVGTQAAHAHSAVLQTALDLGIVGAALFVLVFIRLVARSVRLIRFAPRGIGFFPLAFATYVFLYSVTESGVYGRSLDFLLFVVVVTEASVARRVASGPTWRQEAVAPTPRPVAAMS